jgi:uncharacterized protein with HEPN domain
LIEERDREWLADMLEHARKALQILGPLDEMALAADETKLFAVSLAIQIVGEAASHVSGASRSALPELPWREIVAMRQRLVHGYRTRSPLVIVQTIREDLPQLIAALEKVLEGKSR